MRLAARSVEGAAVAEAAAVGREVARLAEVSPVVSRVVREAVGLLEEAIVAVEASEVARKVAVSMAEAATEAEARAEPVAPVAAMEEAAMVRV